VVDFSGVRRFDWRVIEWTEAQCWSRGQPPGYGPAENAWKPAASDRARRQRNLLTSMVAARCLHRVFRGHSFEVINSSCFEVMVSR
jgi:hypothetical protein